MTNTEIIKKALELIANGMTESFHMMMGEDEVLGSFQNITELKEYVYDGNSENMKEDIWYILSKDEYITLYVADDCSINFVDESISYRKLMNMFKKEYLNKIMD